MAADDRTNNIGTPTLFDDVLKTSKSASQFGPVRVYRVAEKPPDDFGRNGDLCIIDNTAVPSTEIAIEQCPTDVGFCQKIFAWVPEGPNKESSTVAGGTDLVGNDEFTINGTSIVLPAGSVFVKDAVTAINAADIPGITASSTYSSASGTAVSPYVEPGDEIIINGVTVTFPSNGGISYIISIINAASISFINASEISDKINIYHSEGGDIALGGANLTDIMGTPTSSGGIMTIVNADGTTVTLADVVGLPLATMGFPLTIANSNLVCGGTWQCFDENGIEIKDHGTSLGSFETIDFTGTGVTITDGGGGEAIVDISGGGGSSDIFKNVFGDSGGPIVASGPDSNLRILGSGIITTSISGDTLTISSTGVSSQNLFDTFNGNTGTITASTPNDTLNIVGAGTISADLVGNTLTISSSGAGSQNVWLTIQDDASSTISAASGTDTLTVAGAGGITTSVLGTTLTITSDGSQIYTDTREPTGFVNRTDSEISFADGTRTLTINVLAPATEYVYYIHGVPFTITATDSIVIPNVDGVHFIYYDNTQTIQTTQTFFDGLILDNALIAYVYWNSTTNTSIMFGDERHGITMDGDTHLHFHLSLGCQYTSGLLVNGSLNPDVASPVDADVQINVATGTIRDEDLSHDIVDNGGKINVFDLEQDISPIAQVPVLYRSGSAGLWYIKSADNFPYIYSGDGSGYVGANALPPWNEFTGGSWQLTEVGNNSFFFVHIFATNDTRHPIVALQGINTYTNKPAGRDDAASELSQISGLPFLEFTPIASLIAEARTAYTNTPQIRFRTTDDGEDYVDWRGNLSYGSAGGGTVQNTYGNLTDGTNIASAAIPNDTITFTGTGGITATVSSNPDTITIDGSGIVSGTILNTSTGTITGGLLTINGGDDTAFDIAEGTGQIVDHATDPLNPTVITVTWGAITGTAATNIGVTDATGVYIDSTGSVVQLAVIGSNIDHKDKIFIGQLGHAQPSTSIQAARNNNDPVHGPAERIGDLSRALGPFNVVGNIYGPNGVNLNLNKTTGNSHSVGINFQNTLENPDVSTDSSLSVLDFRYGHQDGLGGFTTSSSVTVVDPVNYDDGSGSLISVPVGQWTTQLVYWFPGAEETRIEYGQYIYQTAQAALDVLPDPRHQSNPVFAGVGILRAFLILRADATDLTDDTRAIIVEGAKFGAGAGGQFSNSITDLQQAYDNSVSPEIVTDSTRGALTITEGTAVGGNLIEGQDDTATEVFSVDTAGDVTISGSGAPMAVTTINGQPMLTLVDTTRTDKILSVAEQNLVFSENRLNDLDWLDIGGAVDADSGYIMDFDGTVVFATGHCENPNAASKNIHLFIEGVDKGSLGTLSGGTNATFINTTVDLDFNRGDRIRLQAQDGITGIIEDTVVKVSVKWRG